MGFVKGNWLLRCRASELFDWLRSLPENHELAHLCDVYTYTTIISQCGSHQQLRKALELVAEMRSHGVVCNVHTYSALMNVCIKVGPWSLNARFRHRKSLPFSPMLAFGTCKKYQSDPSNAPACMLLCQKHSLGTESVSVDPQ